MAKLTPLQTRIEVVHNLLQLLGCEDVCDENYKGLIQAKRDPKNEVIIWTLQHACDRAVADLLVIRDLGNEFLKSSAKKPDENK